MSDEKSEFKFEILEGPFVEKFMKEHGSPDLFYKNSIMKITPSNCCLFSAFQNYMDRIRDFTVRPDDVWIVTYPKCGTTWTQEMVWLLLNNLDFETAITVDLTERSPFFEFGCFVDRTKRPDFPDSLQQTEDAKSPRCIKTHLPLQLLPKQLWTVRPKIIYVAREAKDVAVSFYHHRRLFSNYRGTCDDFAEAYIAGIVSYGSLWDHILEFWKIRHEPNLFFNTFEEMKKDLPEVVMRIAKFLNQDLSSEQLKQLCEHLSFESMKKNPMVWLESELKIVRKNMVVKEGDNEPFIRKGKVGDWKNYLSPRVAEKIDNWSRENVKGTDYPLFL